MPTPLLLPGRINPDGRVYLPGRFWDTETPPAGGGAQVSAALLAASGTVAAQSSFTTGTISPPADHLILVWTNSSDTLPTGITGCGLTWVQVATIGGVTIEPGACWRALGPSPTSGQLTISHGGTQSECRWIIVDYSGVDTSGSNGSGAVVQSKANEITSGATSLTTTLDNAIGPGNAVAAAFGHRTNEAQTAGGGYTKLGESGGADTRGWAHEWRPDGTTTPSMSWATSDLAKGIAVEIKAGAAAGDDLYVPTFPSQYGGYY